MNRVTERLSLAKEAFLEGEFEKVTALLIPLRTHEDSNISGTASYIAGLAFMAMKETEKAIEQFQFSVDIGNDDPALYEGYGATLQLNARYDKAEEIYTTGIERCGRLPLLLSHWASIEILRGNATHAEDLLKESLNIDDQNHMGWTNLGNLFQIKGHYRDAVTCYKEALKVKEGYDSAISNLLLTSNYTRLPKEEVFAAHTTYCNQIVPAPLTVQRSQSKNSKIRIGYLSGDFKTHSVSYFFAPLLQFHDRDQFEIYCYSDVYSPDTVTLRFEKEADHWRHTAQFSNVALADLIAQDEIDILVDLAGHAGTRRLSVFRSKPAPIAVTYLGYPNTLGVPEVGYRIVDNITDPEGIDDEYYVEKRKRIEPPFLCYFPSNDLPDIGPCPSDIKGYVTFGSCNNLAKLSDETIELWAKLMKQVPNSRLYLKSKPLKDGITSEEIFRRFEGEGILRSKIILEGHRASNISHLNSYNGIDIALDNFPYNGTTTTCEALIMGVPVLTILGDRHAARVSASILTAIDQSELVLSSPEEFIQKGVELANDIEKRKHLRQNLRNQMKSSPLCNGVRLTREIERVYKEIHIN